MPCIPSVIHGAKSCDFFIPQVLTDLAPRVKDKSAKLSDKISMEILKQGSGFGKNSETETQVKVV
jgi:hypothetical protein